MGIICKKASMCSSARERERMLSVGVEIRTAMQVWTLRHNIYLYMAANKWPLIFVTNKMWK